MAVIGAVAFALAASAVRTRRRGFARAASQCGLLMLGVLVGTLVVGLASLPGRTEGGITIPRTLDELSFLAARPTEFLVPAADNPILGNATERIQPGLHGSNAAETTLYLGWLTIALALVWIGFVLLRRCALSYSVVAVTAGLASALLAGLAFAAPSPVGLGGGHLFTWMPSWFLFHVIPEVRIPSRFVALVSTALIPLAGLGLQLISDRVRRRSPATAVGSSLALATAAAAIVLSVVELFPNVWDQTRADRLSEVYQAVERTPSGVLVEYPLDEGSDYKFWQRLHGRPLLNGARIGAEADDLARSLVDPASPGSSEVLAALGVTVIVTRADALDYTDDVPDVPNANWGDGYELVERFPDGTSVWRVIARPAPVVAILRSPAFGGPTRPRDGFIGYPLRLGSGEIELRSKESGSARLSFDISVPEGIRRVLRIAGPTGAITFPVAGRTPVSLVVDVPRGHSRLTVTVDSEQAHGIELSAPRMARTNDGPTLRAEPISPDAGF